MEGAAAIGLVLDGKAPSRVAGVKVRMPAHDDGGTETLLPADLVVDAPGRNPPSRTGSTAWAWGGRNR